MHIQGLLNHLLVHSLLHLEVHLVLLLLLISVWGSKIEFFLCLSFKAKLLILRTFLGIYVWSLKILTLLLWLSFLFIYCCSLRTLHFFRYSHRLYYSFSILSLLGYTQIIIKLVKVFKFIIQILTHLNIQKTDIIGTWPTWKFFLKFFHFVRFVLERSLSFRFSLIFWRNNTFTCLS